MAKTKPAQTVIRSTGASTSMLQRKMMLGYNKANYLMEEMEKLGVVGQFNGAKPRKVLINSIDELNAT